MSFFCLSWIPLFYLFWISLSPEDSPRPYEFWALFLGGLTALASFFLGPLIEPGGFGFSRWLSAYIDIVCLPVICSVLVGFLLSLTPLFPSGGSFTNFALLWLVPVAVMRTISWGVQKDPLHLVLVPLLWTALATGISVLPRLLSSRRGKIFLLIPLGLILLSITAAASYWAFFSQRFYLGLLFLLFSLCPMGIKTVNLFLTNRRP